MRPRDWLPWRRFVVETSWSPSVVAIEIGKRIADPRLFSRDAERPFVGTRVAEGSFRFSRAISYRNSFLPVIEAVVEPSPNGARVRVALNLNPLVAIFMAVWMAGATMATLMAMGHALSTRRPDGFLVLGFPLFGAALVSVGFAFEARKAEALIRDIFANAPGVPAPPDTGEPYR
jgi:hypothetical protein